MTWLKWGVKESLRSYLRGMGGAVTLSDGVQQARDGTYLFPAADAGELSFRGVVTMDAHGGMLRWEIANPSLVDGQLWIDGNDGARICVARRREERAVLTEDGAFHFALMYAAGETVDLYELVDDESALT